MPTPRRNEKRGDYVSRCIPIVIDEGTAKDPQQAAAICHSMFGEAKKADEEGIFINRFELIRRAKKRLSKKAGYFGGATSAVGESEPDPHFAKDGSFVGGFDSCVEHMVECEGHDPTGAQNICNYLAPRGDETEGAEEPEFGTYGPLMQADRPYMSKGLEKPWSYEASMFVSTKAWRARQTDPDQYKRIRYGEDFFGTGISAVWGVKDRGGKEVTELQSIVFDDKKFTEAQARAWLKEHDKKIGIEATGEATEKDTPERFGVETVSEMSTVAGRYQEFEKVKLPGKPNDLGGLEEIVLPENLKPRSFGAMEGSDLPKSPERPKKLWGLEEIEIPEKLKPRQYGMMEDEIKVKQP